MPSLIRRFLRPSLFALRTSKPPISIPSRLPPGNKNTKYAQGGAAALFLGMATYYSTTVSQPMRSGPETDDKGEKAHHIKGWFGDKTVAFENPYPSFRMFNIVEALRSFTYERYVTKTLKFPSPKLEDKVVPVVKPEFLSSRTGSGALRATWLGHSCYYVEFASGLRVLFDPVFEDHCAPIKAEAFKRYTEPPCGLGELPVVDAVIISHSHYDHLSHPSVLEVQKHHPNAHFFVGLGLEKWFRASGINNVTEMDWWDQAELTLTPKAGSSSGGEKPDNKGVDEPIKATISCLPCQHGSGRTPTDRNSTLWASWAVSSGSAGSAAKSVWFGGDTGYRTVPKVQKDEDDWLDEKYVDLPHCPQFKQIGDKFGGFDLGLIPIGAYSPRHLMSPVHANPFDSVEIFRDTGCRRAMGIHWGTWVLTSEAVLEPPEQLKKALKRRGMPETGLFDVCNIGETREF